jgi:hypothetical protein
MLNEQLHSLEAERPEVQELVSNPAEIDLLVGEIGEV